MHGEELDRLDMLRKLRSSLAKYSCNVGQPVHSHWHQFHILAVVSTVQFICEYTIEHGLTVPQPGTTLQFTRPFYRAGKDVRCMLPPSES